jgi:hypothetical protein
MTRRAAHRASGLGPLGPLARRAAACAFALAPLAGCLSVPEESPPMCERTDDCNQGEACDEGVCWGNPPPGPFAGVVSPPSTRHDLAPRELAMVSIPLDGRLDDIALDPPVQLSGRINAFCPPPMTGCDPEIGGATVTVSRRSQFHGGPGFKTVVNVDADTFSIPVPRTGDGDEPYSITIVPDGGGAIGTMQATTQSVPPRRTRASPGDNLNLGTLELGGADLPVISGALTNGLGQGLAGYRVAALGRWDPAEPASEVSSVALTDSSGVYAITLSAELVGTVELVARPPSGTVSPTLRVASIDATKSSQKNVIAPPDLGAMTQLKVHVNGVYRNGSISEVPGAAVSVTAALTRTTTSFIVDDEQLTDKYGDVVLRVLDGPALTGLYRLSVTPPASSSLGVSFEDPIALAPGSMTSTTVQLASRVALRGKVIDVTARPLANVAVTARPSLRFLWTLDAAPQAFVAAIPAATTATDSDGHFVLWVDASVAAIWGNYDLVFEAPTTSDAPTYLQTAVEIPGDATVDSVTLDDTQLPEAAFVHGRIADPRGDSVEGAELKLFRVATEVRLCSEVAHAPASCPIPAQLQGRNTSDMAGMVRLALPR